MKTSCLFHSIKFFGILSFYISSLTLFAQPPYADNNQALFGRCLGLGVDGSDLPTPSHLWGPGMNFTCWNGNVGCNNNYAIGSQNHPVIAEAARGNYQWVAALCRYEKQHGIFGRELGAPAYYFANVLAAKMVALRDARAAGNYSDAKDIAESLRCVWALNALIAIPTARKNVWQNLHGQIYTNAGDQSWYTGLTCASAGDRWHTETNINHDTHGEYLSWALDWPGRSNSSNNLLNSNGKWWGEITAQLGGLPYFTQSMAPEVFGLNAAERQKLQDVVNGDVNAAKWAAQVVAGFGTWKDPNVPVQNCYVKMRIRRTSLGAEMVYFNSTNGNKPTQAATQVLFNGDYNSIRPANYHGVGANNGYTCWVANGLIQADCPGDGAYVSMSELGGNIDWQMDVDGSVLVFNGTTLTAAAPASYPNTPDVGISAILTPGTTLLNDTLIPKVTVKNYGTVNVNNIYVSYQLNNGLMLTSTWRGTLAPGASVNVTLHDMPVTQGQYTLAVYTGGPNYQTDNNTGNDIKTLIFNISPSTQTIDAGISSIVNPTSSITVDSLQPIAKLKNFGQANLTSATILYKLDNGSPVTLPWTGNLAPGATINFTFSKIPIAPGTHTLQAYTSQPNNQTDANTNNDSKTVTFTVVSPYLTDVEAVSVSQPLVYGCATTIQPQLVMQNLGPYELFQISINYRIDANPVVSATYSVPMGTGLTSGSAMAIAGAASTANAGTHTIKMWVSNPNNVGDLDNSNDTVYFVFTIVASGLPIPFTEDFENVTPGLIPANWSLFNPDAFNEWFVYAMQTNRAAAFNNLAYTNAQNAKDELLMPDLDLTGSSTAWLTFDYSHASQPGSIKFDSLEVLISTDCGVSFTSLWGLGGTGLNTAPDQSAIFIPAGPQDYMNAQINLGAYTQFSNAIIKFINWSNAGNSTLVDNVNISNSQTGIQTGQEALTINVFPNPTNGYLQVNCYLQKKSELKVKLVNMLGETIKEINYEDKAPAFSRIEMDLSDYEPGVYYLWVNTGMGDALSKKIIVAR